jgi:hypothetical protein
VQRKILKIRGLSRRQSQTLLLYYGSRSGKARKTLVFLTSKPSRRRLIRSSPLRARPMPKELHFPSRVCTVVATRSAVVIWQHPVHHPSRRELPIVTELRPAPTSIQVPQRIPCPRIQSHGPRRHVVEEKIFTRLLLDRGSYSRSTRTYSIHPLRRTFGYVNFANTRASSESHLMR